MKIAILLDRANFDRYADTASLPKEWELIHFGNGVCDEDAVAASGADVMVTDPMTAISGALLRRMDNLKLVQSQGVGYNLIDLEAAAERGIFVANSAGANAAAVAEQALLLILALLRNLKEFDEMVFAARQMEAKTRCFKNGITELGECHVGIVGMGAIGRELCKRLLAFGTRVSYYDKFQVQDCGAQYLPLDELYTSCDIISLHLPALPETVGMINDETLAKMRPGALLINTARGELVDQEAVARAIADGRLGGAGFDTLSPEPVTADNPLLQLDGESRYRLVLSPHIGGITSGSFRRYYDVIWENVRRIAAGERPKNIVNGI